MLNDHDVTIKQLLGQVCEEQSAYVVDNGWLSPKRAHTMDTPLHLVATMGTRSNVWAGLGLAIPLDKLVRTRLAPI